MKSETEADCISATGGAHVMFYFTKKEKNSSMPSSPTWQEQPRQHFQIAPSISSSSQLSISPETMSSDTVHAADLCITAQKTIGNSQDTWELGKCDKNPWPMIILVPKRTQGVAPRPRLVRVLLSLCGSDLRSVVWWRGVSPKILATIKLLSPGLLGGIVTGLWKPRSIGTCMAWPVIENQPTKHKRTLKKPLQRRRRPYPDIKGRPYSIFTYD